MSRPAEVHAAAAGNTGAQDIAQADHADQVAVDDHRQVAVAATQHQAGRLFGIQVGFAGVRIRRHPAFHRCRSQIVLGGRGPKHIAFGEDAQQHAAVNHDH